MRLSLTAQPQQLRLVNDLHAERLRLVQFGPSFRTGADVSEAFQKPLIAVVNSHTEFNPGHMHLDRLAQRVKDGVHAGGGSPYEFDVTRSSSATRGSKVDRACPKPSPSRWP